VCILQYLHLDQVLNPPTDLHRRRLDRRQQAQRQCPGHLRTAETESCQQRQQPQQLATTPAAAARQPGQRQPANRPRQPLRHRKKYRRHQRGIEQPHPCTQHWRHSARKNVSDHPDAGIIARHQRGKSQSMPKRLFRKYLPSPEKIRHSKSLSFLGALLTDPNLWHINRHSLAGAAFIGIFSAFLPIPMQMGVAAILAVRFKCNLPLSIVLVWITNPLTIAPVFYFTFTVGAWILGAPQHMPVNIRLGDLLDYEKLSTFFAPQTVGWLIDFLQALWLGSVLFGLLFGVLAWGMVKLAWRLSVVRKWQQRRELRRLRKEKEQERKD